jgi:hypothetical protein
MAQKHIALTLHLSCLCRRLREGWLRYLARAEKTKRWEGGKREGDEYQNLDV